MKNKRGGRLEDFGKVVFESNKRERKKEDEDSIKIGNE